MLCLQVVRAEMFSVVQKDYATELELQVYNYPVLFAGKVLHHPHISTCLGLLPFRCQCWGACHGLRRYDVLGPFANTAIIPALKLLEICICHHAESLLVHRLHRIRRKPKASLVSIRCIYSMTATRIAVRQPPHDF